MKPKCCICGKIVNPKNTHAINSQYGLRYYCDNKVCHTRFIEDAGERPDEPE